MQIREIRGTYILTDCTDLHWYSGFLCQSVLVGGWYYLPRGNIPLRLCFNHWMPRKCTETRDILHPCAARRNLNYLNQTYLHHSLDSLDFSTEGRRMLDSEGQYSSVSIRGTYIPTDCTDLHWYSVYPWQSVLVRGWYNLPPRDILLRLHFNHWTSLIYTEPRICFPRIRVNLCPSVGHIFPQIAQIYTDILCFCANPCSSVVGIISHLPIANNQ